MPVANVFYAVGEPVEPPTTCNRRAEIIEKSNKIYIADFSGPYNNLKARNLISREDSVHQYRFKDVIDLDTGKVLHHIEHEIRSLMHPLYARPLINRNAEQNIRNFVPGQEAYIWTLP